jgi:DNA-binding transcriptional ArsR family regulator/rhodanese-related sulfurtransferase
MSGIIYQNTARIGQAMASPIRLRALNLLAQRPQTVGELAEKLGQSKASTSAHLKVLRGACLVVDEHQGRKVWCRLASDDVARLLVSMRGVAETLLPEMQEVVRQAEADPDALESISLRKLASEVKAGRVRLIDLRPGDEYEAGHLPNAESLPFEQIKPADLRRLATESASESATIAYCRGPWCVMARKGVERLRKAGVNVKRLPAGVAEWRAAGLRLEN